MHITARLFLLRVVDIRVEVSRERPITAGGVGVEPTADVDGEVRGLLHRLHREIAGRLEDDCPLATAPGDNRWPIFVVVPPTRFTLLAASTCPTSPPLLATPFRLALLAGGVIEVIGFDRAVYLIAQPPAPAITGPDMDPHLFGNTPRCTREAQQKRGENPMPQRAIAHTPSDYVV